MAIRTDREIKRAKAHRASMQDEIADLQTPRPKPVDPRIPMLSAEGTRAWKERAAEVARERAQRSQLKKAS